MKIQALLFFFMFAPVGAIALPDSNQARVEDLLLLNQHGDPAVVHLVSETPDFEGRVFVEDVNQPDRLYQAQASALIHPVPHLLHWPAQAITLYRAAPDILVSESDVATTVWYYPTPQETFVLIRLWKVTTPEENGYHLGPTRAHLVVRLDQLSLSVKTVYGYTINQSVKYEDSLAWITLLFADGNALIRFQAVEGIYGPERRIPMVQPLSRMTMGYWR